MTKLFLDSTDTNYTVSNSNLTIYGASSSQTISINSSITGIVVDANVEGVQFSDALSAYKFKQTGNRLEVYANDGTTLISKIGLQGDSNGTQLTFTDGVFDTKYAPTVSNLNLTIGGQIVNNTAPSIVTIPTAFNLTSASENITGTAGDDIVNVGAFTATGTYALDTGNDTINALTGANIAGVNSGATTTAESLVMAGIVTMTASQYAGFSTITAAGASDHIVLTTQATGLTLNPSIENFTLGNFANSVTLSGTGQTVVGGTGADTVIGGAGSDTITGGAGSDTFVFNTPDIDTTGGMVTDEITDFASGTDKLSFDVAGIAGVAQVSTITIGGSVEANEVINIQGVALASVSVTAAADAGTTATMIKTAIDAAAGSKVDVTVSAGVVTLTAKIPGDSFIPLVTVADGTSVTSGTGTTATVATLTSASGNYIENLTPVADLATLLTAADTALDGTIKYYFGVDGSDGYLVTDSDGTGYTDVIKLTGVMTISTADIVAAGTF